MDAFNKGYGKDAWGDFKWGNPARILFGTFIVFGVKWLFGGDEFDNPTKGTKFLQDSLGLPTDYASSSTTATGYSADAAPTTSYSPDTPPAP